MKKEIGPDNAMLRERSGSVNTHSNLVAFFYTLLRDGLPAGVVEGMVNSSHYETEWHLSNGWVAQHAKDIVNRLLMSDHERDVLGVVEGIVEQYAADNDADKKVRTDAIAILRRLRNP